jgi:hypothetical protein
MGEVLEYQISYDANGNHLSGSRNYRLHLPTNTPRCKFWSVIVYDQSDNLMIRTDQPWPSIHSNLKRLDVNEDGSTDVFFGPKAPLNKINNWIRTLPGKKWYAIIRLYEPLEKFRDTSWKPDDIVESHK